MGQRSLGVAAALAAAAIVAGQVRPVYGTDTGSSTGSPPIGDCTKILAVGGYRLENSGQPCTKASDPYEFFRLERRAAADAKRAKNARSKRQDLERRRTERTGAGQNRIRAEHSHDQSSGGRGSPGTGTGETDRTAGGSAEGARHRAGSGSGSGGASGSDSGHGATHRTDRAAHGAGRDRVDRTKRASGSGGTAGGAGRGGAEGGSKSEHRGLKKKQKEKYP